MYGWDVKLIFRSSKRRFYFFYYGDGQFNMSDLTLIYKIIIKKNQTLLNLLEFAKDGNARYYQSKSYNFLFKILF